MRIRRFIHFLLFFIVLALLWRVIETWSRSQPTIAPTSQAQLPEEAPLRFPPIPPPAVGKQLAHVIAEKDLFSPTRSRAVEEVQPTAAAIPPPAHLKLVGVLLFPDHEEAFFADSSQGGKVVRVRRGETLGSYRLVQVMPLQATLTMGQEGEEVSLPLVVIDSGTAAKAPRLTPPPVAQPVSSLVGRRQARAAAPNDAGEFADETRAIRQNIQQLQRRLRQIRRQAARQQAENPEEEPQEEPSSDEVIASEEGE